MQSILSKDRKLLAYLPQLWYKIPYSVSLSAPAYRSIFATSE